MIGSSRPVIILSLTFKGHGHLVEEWEMQKSIVWIALVVAFVALGLAMFAAFHQPETPVGEAVIEQRVYERIVREVHAELKPAYADFGVEIKGRPESLQDVLRPLIGVTNTPLDRP